MTTFYDRKRELENKLSDAAIDLAVAQQNVVTLTKRLDKLGAEYKAVKDFIAKEEAIAEAEAQSEALYREQEARTGIYVSSADADAMQAADAAADAEAERRYNRGRSQTEMDNADYERAVMPREI